MESEDTLPASYIDTDIETLYRRYARLVYWRAHRMLGDAELAHDVTQETFVIAIKLLPQTQFPVEAAVRSWLQQIAVRRCIYVLRQRRRRIQWVTLDDRFVEPATFETPE